MLFGTNIVYYTLTQGFPLIIDKKLTSVKRANIFHHLGMQMHPTEASKRTREKQREGMQSKRGLKSA